MLLNDKWRYWITDLLLLCLIIGSAFAFLLGNRPLNVPDEARYCEIPREMLVMSNFVTPHINGIKYFEKPPLFYWVQASNFKWLGLSEWACRTADALIALLGCLAVYAATRKLFNRQAGLFASIILATSFMYFALARVITLDMMVSALITFSLLSFLLGMQQSPGLLRRCYFYLLYSFSALAVLTKGLIGIIFPGAIIFLWMLICSRWKELKHCYLFSGSLLLLLIAAPWHILAQQANPEFFQFYFINQQFMRYLTMEAGRYQPVWYYLPLLVLGLFPWTGFLYGALRKLSRQQPTEIFLVIWATFIFVFFSLSHSKLVPYILPCLPPLAILIGLYFSQIKNEAAEKKALWFGFGFAICIAIGLIIAIPLNLTPEVTTDFRLAKFWSTITLMTLSIFIISIPYIFYKRGFFSAFIIQSFLMTLFLFSVCAALPYIYMDSIKPLALELKKIVKDDEMVATYDYYYQDLPFYLNRLVTIVNWEGELEFGKAHQNPGNRMINDADFWKAWQSNQNVYMFVPNDILQDLKKHTHYHFYPIAQEKNDILLTNHERKP